MSDPINAAITLLRAQGFVITRPEWGPWLTQTDLLAEYQHLKAVALHKRLRAFRGEFPEERSGTGRLKRLRTTPELRAWLQRPVAQGQRTDLRNRK